VLHLFFVGREVCCVGQTGLDHSVLNLQQARHSLPLNVLNMRRITCRFSLLQHSPAVVPVAESHGVLFLSRHGVENLLHRLFLDLVPSFRITSPIIVPLLRLVNKVGLSLPLHFDREVSIKCRTRVYHVCHRVSYLWDLLLQWVNLFGSAGLGGLLNGHAAVLSVVIDHVCDLSHV
jgi:hypothetical protein